MLEEYVMSRKLLKRLNSKESSSNFEKVFNDDILEVELYFHLRLTATQIQGYEGKTQQLYY